MYLSVNEKVTTEERDMIREKNSICTNNHVMRISTLSWRKAYSPTYGSQTRNRPMCPAHDNNLYIEYGNCMVTKLGKLMVHMYPGRQTRKYD